MKLDDYSYSNIFNNDFSPHLEIFSFNWNIKKNTDIQPEFTEKSQIFEEYPENETTLKEESKQLQTTDKSVSYEIKDITPKKRFWRK